MVEEERYFPSRSCTKEEIRQAQQDRKKKDRMYGEGSLSYPAASPDRWSGVIGEDFFKECARELAVDRRNQPRLSFDFEVGDRKIDIKCLFSRYPPGLHHHTAVPAAHVSAKRESTHFIFCQYDYTGENIHLVGSIIKASVKDLAFFHEKGELMVGSGKPCAVPFYEIPIANTTDIEEYIHPCSRHNLRKWIILWRRGVRQPHLVLEAGKWKE